MVELRSWQVAAFNKWMELKQKGTIEACTGSGKTIFGIHCIKQATGRVLVTVPTIQLLKQWRRELKEALGEEIGCYYGSEKVIKRIVVGTHLSLQGKKIKDCELLVCDEVHKMQTDKNTDFLILNNFQKILGLSATPEREDIAKNEYILKIAPIIYRYTIQDAIAEGVLSKFELKKVAVPFTNEESVEYDRVDQRVKELFKEFDYDLHALMSKKNAWKQSAIECKRLIQRRKELIYYAENKPAYAVKLIQAHPNEKVIVFDERIGVVERTKTALERAGIASVIYHSAMPTKERESVFEGFRTGLYRVLLSVRALEEGINVPDASVAVLVNGSSVQRQKIQRFGRVLRKAPNKAGATIYQLYIPSTKDEDWLYK